VFDVRFLPAGAIPRTTSGKLARRACRDEYLSAS
jgi:fatty-acyl-CoA synthase